MAKVLFVIQKIVRQHRPYRRAAEVLNIPGDDAFHLPAPGASGEQSVLIIRHGQFKRFFSVGAGDVEDAEDFYNFKDFLPAPLIVVQVCALK